ncbi:hypothetical protein DPMN_063620 [Dreissena polymorpha]|uniref:Uncharacterized protein n=1 Tax=Dreissena polymorpha TaxID=45954 RepID=A0A9D4CAU9_DREPO|nr:hypothetical protein DPMN_063620 [Dreissena polymorpha]
MYFLFLYSVQGNFGWVWPIWVGRLRVGNGAMHIEGSSAYSLGEDSGQDGQTDGRTDRRTAEITTISPRFSKSVGITIRKKYCRGRRIVEFRTLLDNSDGNEKGKARRKLSEP